MIKILFILVALFICFQIFYQKGHKKIIWLLGGLLFFPHSVSITNEPFALTFHRLFIYSLIVYTIINKKSFWIVYQRMPVMWGLTVVLIANLITGLLDPRLSIFLQLYRPITNFTENFLVLFLSYLYITKFSDAIAVFKKFIIFLVIFGIYGLSNYITKTNEYYNILEVTFGASNFANANMAQYIQRFRVSSFAFHAMLYGLIITIGLLIFFYIFQYHLAKRQKVFYLFILGLLFVNLLLVNSRTPLLSLFAGFSVFYLFAFNIRHKIQIFSLAIILFFVAGIFLEDFRQIVYATLDVFSSEPSEVGGSSLEMRKEQLQASIEVFSQKPISGNGFQYVGETLGYRTDRSTNTAPEELRGMESYLFKLLMEQGIIGVISNVVLFAGLFTYFIHKSRAKVSRSIALLGIGLLIAFLIFILGTGALNSFPFFMLLLGCCLKATQLSRVTTTPEPQKISAAA